MLRIGLGLHPVLPRSQQVTCFFRWLNHFKRPTNWPLRLKTRPCAADHEFVAVLVRSTATYEKLRRVSMEAILATKPLCIMIEPHLFNYSTHTIDGMVVCIKRFCHFQFLF